MNGAIETMRKKTAVLKGENSQAGGQNNGQATSLQSSKENETVITLQGPNGPIVGKVETITPELATVMRKKPHPLQRDLAESAYQRTRKAKEFAADMRGGQWYENTHQALAFSPEDECLDGLTRLEAIELAGVPVKMLVFRGVPATAMAYLDIGRMRKAHDLARAQGLEWHPRVIQIAVCMTKGLSQANDPFLSSHRAKIAVTRQHVQAATFAYEAIEGKGARRHIFLEAQAVCARAWYTQNKERVARFLQVYADPALSSGLDDQAAVVYHKFSIDCTRRDSTSTCGKRAHVTKADKYRKAERCLLAFLRREQVGKLFGCAEEAFVLPE